MASSETLLKAVLNRLKTRLDNKLASSALKASDFIKVTPDQIKKQWDLFKEEVIDEADRMNEMQNEGKDLHKDLSQKATSDTLQSKINKLKKEIVKLSTQIEEIN